MMKCNNGMKFPPFKAEKNLLRARKSVTAIVAKIPLNGNEDDETQSEESSDDEDDNKSNSD